MKTRKPSGNVEMITNFTAISSKGQIVIPKAIRTMFNTKEGDLFAATTVGEDMIVLKRVHSSLTEEEQETLRKVDAAWKEIESGHYKSYSKETFLKHLKKW